MNPQLAAQPHTLEDSKRPRAAVDRQSGARPGHGQARWQVRPARTADAERLMREAGMPALAARVMAARGIIDPAEAQRFLRPSLGQLHNPFELKGMEAAVERIGRAIAAGESIHVYGDYDVDGVTGTAILMQTLGELGVESDYYIPHRLNEGYGLNCEAIELLAERGAQLIISVDCGITAVAEAARARELGVDLIVTDHHQPGDELPRCSALINPKQPGCEYPFKGLAGAGVAFKLAHALLKTLHPDEARAREFLKSLLDLAALGTVADIVPLVGENRAIVTYGLTLLRDCRRIGLIELCSRAGLEPAKCDTGQIGFVLGPRLNAAGRTEHAKYGVELLLTDDRATARRLAEHLEQFNLNRRAIEHEIVNEALAMIDPGEAERVIVLAQPGWHHGVLGIVASRVLQRHYRPTIIIGVDDDGVAKGSGRSIAGFDLHAALHHCSEHLVQFGGHTMAAGMTLAADKVDDFRDALREYALASLRDEDMCPLINIDTVASAADLTEEGVGQLELLAPFGHENHKPLVLVEDFNLVEEPRILKERHLKLRLATARGVGIGAIGWNMAERAEELRDCRGPIQVVGTPQLNAWNGRTNIEIEIKDFRLG